MPAHVDEGEIDLQVDACKKPLENEPAARRARDVRVVIRNRLKMILFAILLCGVAWLAYDVSQVSGQGGGRRGVAARGRAGARPSDFRAPSRQLSPSLDDADPRAVELWLDRVRAASARAAPLPPALPPRACPATVHRA